MGIIIKDDIYEWVIIMTIQMESLNGNKIIKFSGEIYNVSMKEFIDATHTCMLKLSSEENLKVIFDRSFESTEMSKEKSAVVEELNDFLVSHCEKVATLFDHQKEKKEYNFKCHRKGDFSKTKGFTTDEIERAKTFLNF